jgi:hypothetical protein
MSLSNTLKFCGINDERRKIEGNKILNSVRESYFNRLNKLSTEEINIAQKTRDALYKISLLITDDRIEQLNIQQQNEIDSAEGNAAVIKEMINISKNNLLRLLYSFFFASLFSSCLRPHSPTIRRANFIPPK